MFRPATIRRLTRRLQTLAVWAMIPLAVLNARTVSGCICANGRYESACDTAVCGGAHEPLLETSSAAACGCACCAQRTSQHSGGDCCRKTSCCSTNEGQQPEGTHGESFSSKSCCHPVSQLRVTPTVVVKSQVNELRPLELLSIEATTSSQSIFAAAAQRFADTGLWCSPDTGPALVITLRKLVI